MSFGEEGDGGWVGWWGGDLFFVGGGVESPAAGLEEEPAVVGNAALGVGQVGGAIGGDGWPRPNDQREKLSWN